MAIKKITLIASKQKYYFEIEEYNSKHLLSKITYGGWLGDKKIKDKIGETKSFEDAITLAKVSIGQSIDKIEID